MLTFRKAVREMAQFAPYYCSTLDSMFPPVVQNWVLCFPCDTSNVHRISDVLQAGFEKTIQQRPYLAGRLSREDTGPRAGRLKLTYPDDERVERRFSVSDLTHQPDIWRPSYEELRRLGMPVAQLDPGVLVPPGGYERLGSCPIVAQANFIPGGCLLDVCLNHSFVDGLGGAMAIGAWAKNCKEIQKDTNPVTSSDDGQWQMCPDNSREYENEMASQPLRLPDILQDSTAPHGEEVARIQEDRTLWQLLGLQKPPTDSNTTWGSPSNKVMVSAIFAASAESIFRLKMKSTPDANDKGDVPFVSSFDATAALFWRCILRARYLDLEGPEKLRSRLRIPINLRQILGVPQDYPGNVLLNSLTEMPVESVIAKHNQRQVASRIRSSLVFSRNATRVLDAVKLSFVLPDFSSRRPLFSDTTGQDLVLTSWQDLPYYKHDWGPMFGFPGNAEFFRIPHGYLRGICALQPKRVDNTVEALVNLEQGQMDPLKNDVEFTEYFELKAV